jgi:hypothetical protein
MQLFAAICWLLRCCLLRVCAPLVQAASMSDRVNTRKQACIRTLACCATRMVSCSCLQAVLNTVVCMGLVQGLCNMANTNTGCKACLTASTHANRHAHLYSSVLQLSLCSCGCLQSIHCRMHRVCAACLETRYSLQGPLYRRNTSNRCSGPACWAACLVLMQVFAASC